ncbi:MAG: MFS transporter [Armatimonadetes bacterium]|nr:MFS transporter [Armatimonadota bacterium]
MNLWLRSGLSRNAPPLRRWQGRVVLTVFITYATYYFCRQNVAAALPAIGDEFGLSRASLGQITMALFIGYGIGQVFFGLLADRFGARYLLLTGMLVSAGLNVSFALSHPVVPMVVLWGLNGMFQASGMPACAKTIANWFTPAQRGRVQAVRGMDYPVGALLVTLLSGWLVQYLGWRWAFYVPAGVLAVSAVHTFVRLRGAPEEVGLPPVERHGRGAGPPATPGTDTSPAGATCWGWSSETGGSGRWRWAFSGSPSRATVSASGPSLTSPSTAPASSEPRP